MSEAIDTEKLGLIRQGAADAIRTFCQSLGAGVVTTSSDGVERIYYSGISLDALSAAVAIKLRSLAVTPAQCGAAQPVAWRWRRADESTWVIIDRAPKFANPANFVVEPLYKTAPLTPAEGEDPFNRKQVEALCRAVCKVEGVDPDDDTFGDGCDPAWTRYADAVAEVLWHTPVDCSCARAGFPGSCDNCDVDSGPVKFWRDRAERAEAQVEDVQRKLIEANNKLIDINHALLNREDPDWKVLAAARSASLTSTVGRPNE